MADTTTELEVLDQIVDVLGGQSGQYETVVPVLRQIKELLGGGGGGGGYNPALSVGRADALTGADETAQWATRVTAGSGAATVRSVQGAAIGYNQLVKRPYYSESTTVVRDVNFNVNDGYVTASGTASAGGSWTFVVDEPANIVAGHKMLLTGIDTISGVGFRVYSSDTSTTYLAKESAGPVIFTPNVTSSKLSVYLLFSSGAEVSFAGKPQLFDLTQMFGSGKEPTTVAEFEQMFPASYYPYSAPTLKPVQIAGIRSTDAQGGELDAIEWTAQTLRAAGSVRDELTSDELVTRVGVVDLGTLTWLYNSNTSLFNANLDGAVRNKNTGVRCSCAIYTAVEGYGTSGAINDHSVDKACSVGSSYQSSTQNLLIRDTSYTDPATFKAAMSGVLLYYELATPTTTPISPALPMTYKVQEGGSESIIVPDGEVSAAPVLTIAEGESAADVVMDALAAIAAPDGPTATANHAANTYLTMQGKLYKVTSAIAVGESITPNTNVTETTVMAELVARTA